MWTCSPGTTTGRSTPGGGTWTRSVAGTSASSRPGGRWTRPRTLFRPGSPWWPSGGGCRTSIRGCRASCCRRTGRAPMPWPCSPRCASAGPSRPTAAPRPCSAPDPASAGGVARVVALGADLVGVGVVDLFEDGQCSLPRVASRVDLAGGLVRLAEAGQRAGLVVAVAEVPVRDQGLLVVLGGLGVVPEVVVGVAEAVPRVGLPVAVAERRP